MVRLCHQLALECEELPRPFHRQVLVPGGHRISLPYEFLVPCLCIEASYPHRDSLRSKRCPFQEQPDAYGPELWSSVHFHDYSTSSKDQMAMVLSASCPLRPRATLCWREVAAEAAPCHDVPNSTASEEEQVYTLDKVDVHPLLCFRFSYGNSSHVECPHRPEPAWNVSLSVRGLQLRLHLTSSVPASFSAALCQRRGGQCEPEAPVYTVTRPEGSAPGELALLLPVQVLGSCVLVWRSDVRFARKQLLCPDVSRRHFGLLGLALALGLVVTVLLLNCRGAWRPPAGAAGGRPVLLLYSPDSEEHLGLVCALAELLRAGLGCEPAVQPPRRPPAPAAPAHLPPAPGAAPAAGCPAGRPPAPPPPPPRPGKGAPAPADGGGGEQRGSGGQLRWVPGLPAAAPRHLSAHAGAELGRALALGTLLVCTGGCMGGPSGAGCTWRGLG
uniref:Interleukin 17 receptor E n=1 Tax=Anser cygnoides TaxID=8845 RepID=A0A8B9EJ16_ANSCY